MFLSGNGQIGVSYLVFSSEPFCFFLVLLRQVANAAKVNASAVLIYPDPDDFEFEDTTELFGHVSVKRHSFMNVFYIEILQFSEVPLHSSVVHI